MSTDRNINKYSLVPYDPNWPKQFEQLRTMLLGVFGEKALQVEHIGSTAITGMVAKPIIDALVIVEKMEDFMREKQAMTDKGYEYKENYIASDTVLFFKVNVEGEKVENIHVCEKDSPKAKHFLVMRDFFRTFPDKARAYSDLKKANAERYPDSYSDYRAAKKSFLDQIEKEASQ